MKSCIFNIRFARSGSRPVEGTFSKSGTGATDCRRRTALAAVRCSRRGRGGKPMGCRAIRREDGPDLSERGTAMAPVGREYAVGRDEKAPPSVPPADLRASLPKTRQPVAKGRENYGTAFDRSFTGTGGRNVARHSPVSEPDALRGKRRTAVRRRSTAEKRPPVP